MYLTLQEAAEYVAAGTGRPITPDMLLRLGIQGRLLVCAAFSSCKMYNALEGKDEDVGPSLLVIPPRHLMEIETDGAARIEYASGVDKKQYFPYQTRTREQLRICCQHLDEFLTRLGNCIPESTNNSSQETTDKAASTRDRQASQNPNKLTDPTAMGNQTSSRLGITKAQALVAFGDLVKAINFANALEDVPQWIRDARVSKGTPGQRHKTIWCPVLLAITLHERQLVRKGQLTKVFFDHEFLKQWRQEWHEKSEYLS